MKSNKLFHWNNLFVALTSILFSLILIEVILYLLAEKGKLHINRPAYSFGQVRYRFWADIHPEFGVWHEPHSHYHQSKSCYDVDYNANSYGARDVERARKSEKPRIVVLGDSFVEGYGVSEPERFTNLLEKETATEYLNFGTAGAFGPTQYYLLYKSLAKDFDHETVMVGILPFNDFLENDYEFGKNAYPYRYRPYFVGEDPNYQLIYHSKDGLEKGRDRTSGLKTFLRSYSYIFNAMERVVNSLRHRKAMPDPTGEAYSGYYDYTHRQWNLLKYDILKIRKESDGKRLVIFTMPVQSDFIRYQKGKGPPLPEQLRKLAAEEGFTYVDLLPEMAAADTEWRNYFLVCDNHWNDHGHKTAARILKDKIAQSPPKSLLSHR